MLLGLREEYPCRPQFRHAERNSAAHLKASAVGSVVTVIIENGKLLLGTWQGIYFCEFTPEKSEILCKDNRLHHATTITSEGK